MDGAGRGQRALTGQKRAFRVLKWPSLSGRSKFTVTLEQSRMENDHGYAYQYHAPRPGYPQR